MNGETVVVIADSLNISTDTYLLDDAHLNGDFYAKHLKKDFVGYNYADLLTPHITVFN